MDRRRFLEVMGTTGLAAGVGLAGGLLTGGRARAAPWGEYPDGEAQAGLLPEGVRAQRVLEVFLYGGLSPWETFYCVPGYGTPEDPQYPNEQFWTFQSGANGVEPVVADCGYDTTQPLTEPFATDAQGVEVHFGPFVQPLRARPDITDRLRVLVQRHDLEPHEAAIPLALSGRFLGNPKLAGLGAAIAQYWNQRAAVAVPPPFSYVLYPTGVFPTDNLRAASAVGMMPASARPLAIKLEANSSLGQTLARQTVGDLRADYDALVGHYRGRMVARYTRPAHDVPVRSPALTDFLFSSGTLQSTDQLGAILPPELLAKVGGSACGKDSGLDTPGMGMKLAAHLLTHPTAPARYVCLVDGGLIPATGGGGYDTHTDHTRDQARNLWHTLTHLTSVINAPGEDDPAKISLDDTLVILNTEFGRTPYPQNGNGRNHHPYGYVTVMFGGPIGPAQRGIVGSIGPDSLAHAWVTPSEARAAALVAMGIWPFEPEAFAVGDVRDVASEAEAAAWLKAVVLGHPA